MALLPLDLVKGHLRVMHDDEDAQIAAYQAAAESIVTEHLDRTVQAAEPLPVGDATAIVLTPAITAAILLMTGDLYEVREPDPKATGEAMLPPAVRRLLAPWRVWRTMPEDCP